METPPLPLFNHPLHEPSAFIPEALVAAVRLERGLSPRPMPEVCVLECDGDLTDALVAKGIATRCESWACFHTTMFSVQVDGVSFGLIPRTIGGPYAVLVAEQLRASGVRAIVGLTSAGRVNPELQIPSIVIASAAVRDEGTSFHYLPGGSVVEGHGLLAGVLTAELQALPIPVTTGTVWTTDASYRETESQLAEHGGRDAGSIAFLHSVPPEMSPSALLPM